MSSRPMSIPAEANQSFGKWLRGIRESRRVPLRAVAAAAEMDQAHLCKVELGQRLLTKKQIEAIGSFFQVDSDEIEARQIVERFRSDYSGSRAAKSAILMLHEGLATYGTEE